MVVVIGGRKEEVNSLPPVKASKLVWFNKEGRGGTGGVGVNKGSDLVELSLTELDLFVLPPVVLLAFFPPLALFAFGVPPLANAACALAIRASLLFFIISISFSAAANSSGVLVFVRSFPSIPAPTVPRAGDDRFSPSLAPAPFFSGGWYVGTNSGERLRWM